ncbi:MAG TPA: penicillin-binding protein 2 [Bacteroidota bacterium]
MFDSPTFGSLTRATILRSVLGVLFLLLLGRLYQLQMLYHTELGKKSEENSVRAVIQEPIRGYMYDRYGTLVVDVGPAYTVTVTPAAFDAANLEKLAALLQMDKKEIADKITKGRAYSRFSPTRIKRDVDFKMLSALEEILYSLPGVDYQVESKRTYTTSMQATHLLGYVKEITDAQLSRSAEVYRPGDVVGSSGLESSYETRLRGEKGFEFFSVNAQGQFLGSYDGGNSNIRSKEGYDLLLHLDASVQTLAESLMANTRGALVALDPNNGGIIAMVSKPDFDPSVFSGVTPLQLWQQLNSDTTKPLFNRATMTRYPPGSTFKMVIAAAALQDGIIDEHYRITCTGAFRFGDRVFKDLHVHGSTNVLESIQRSCNVFYYQLVLKIGLERFAKYSRMFGFGNPTGVDISEETAGLIPDTEHYDRVYGKGKWTQGYLVSLGIGQGEIGVSPLQMASYAAALANGGTLYKPHAVAAIRNKRTKAVEELGHPLKATGIEPAVMDLLREGMRRVVQEPGGTGGLARIYGIQSAGKTGTAENPHGDDHAWYVGFAPFENPSIAVAVMIENAGFGGSKAAPIAGAVVRTYLRNTKQLPERIAKPTVQDSAKQITQTTEY